MKSFNPTPAISTAARHEDGGGAVPEDSAAQLLRIGMQFANSSAGMFEARCAGGVTDVDDFSTNPGNRRSEVPALGETIWELSEAFKKQSPYLARIDRVNADWNVGFVRIPHFEFNSRHASIFGEIISKFEECARAVVLDISSNPGGSLFQMYMLLSFLCERTIEVPRHVANLWPCDVSEAEKIVALARDGADEEDLPSPELVEYSRTVLEEVAGGRQHATRPLWLGGVSHVRPAAKHYSRKIVAVIDCLSFSAAEFMAAMLQDSKRALLFGGKTAGAGGCGRSTRPLLAEEQSSAQDRLGIADFFIRWTTGFRANGAPIEGVGVCPDIPYQVTIDDLQHGRVGMRNALIAALRL